MNKQEVISKLKSAIPKNNIDDYQRGEAAAFITLYFLIRSLSSLLDTTSPTSILSSGGSSSQLFLI